MKEKLKPVSGDHNPGVTPPISLAWSMWGLCAVFYLIGFFQRVAPGVMTIELMTEFQIGAASLGHLSAFYFYSYVAMQIPTGILADRLGPRRLLATGALVAATGSLLFSLADSLYWAAIGRLLVGGSVSVAFVGMLKLAAHWFPTARYALVSGLALFTGVVGAVAAGVPLRWMVDAVGWRSVMSGSAAFTFLVALAIWILVRDDPTEKGYISYARFAQPDSGSTPVGIISGIRLIFRYRNTALLFIVPGGIVGCILSFSGLWGVPFLTTHYHLSVTQAAGACSILLMAWAVGGPILGGLSDKIRLRKPLYVICTAVATLGWGIILYWPKLHHAGLLGFLAFTGFTSGAMIIGFAFEKESVPQHLSGTASGVINMGVMLGPTLLQPAMGYVLDRYWQGQTANGARLYDLVAYHHAFSLMMAWLVLSLILVMFTRETRCRPSA
ncbi:MAG: MFS transporter [Desulfatirhabdiaceae bacterium]